MAPIGIPSQSARARAPFERFFDGHEDGDVVEWTTVTDPGGDGTGYYFNAQTSSVYEGSYAAEQHLEGSGGSADYHEYRQPAIDDLKNPQVKNAYRVASLVDNNTGFDSRAEIKLLLTLTDGTSETVTYRIATDSSTPSTNASSLFFVPSGHNSSTWQLLDRDLNGDLSAGGYANADSLDEIRYKLHTPGTGGGVDKITVQYDSLKVIA